MTQEVNHKNILSLNEALKAQARKIDDLEKKISLVTNTIATLQQELTTTKALALYSRGTGATT